MCGQAAAVTVAADALLPALCAAGYRWRDWRLDLGYAHLWFDAARTAQPPLVYRLAANVLALGLTRAW